MKKWIIIMLILILMFTTIAYTQECGPSCPVCSGGGVSSGSLGRMLIKQTRARLLENSRELLENAVQKITKCKVISMHTDISTKKGERIIIFILNEDLEKKMDSSINKKIIDKQIQNS